MKTLTRGRVSIVLIGRYDKISYDKINVNDIVILKTKEYKSYYKSGKLHRENSPATIYYYRRKDEFYYINGVLHRLDGPAIIRSNGEKTYYINGEKLNINIKIKKSGKLEIKI